MKSNKLLYIILFTLILGSCKKEIFQQESASSKIVLGKIVNHSVTLEQAKSIAILQSVFPDQLKGEKTTSAPLSNGKQSYAMPKQNLAKSVKNTISIKSTGETPVCYVVNYNEGGFIIIAGDDRMVPILAFNDTGKFSEPSKQNPGLKLWMEDNIQFINGLREGKIKEDKKIPLAWRELEQKSQLSQGKSASFSSEPLCDVTTENETYATEWSFEMHTAQWGQGAPFNSGIPMESCGRPLVGCVPVAASIVMYWHNFPTYIWNWNLMDELGSSSETQKLLADMHVATSSSNSCVNSVATWTNGGSTLAGLGYDTDGFSNYYYPTIKNDILNERPVIVRGERNGTGGHQWVVDGYKEWAVFTCLESQTEDPPIQWRNPPAPTHYWVNTNTWVYLRMNWGWAGLDNAYYSAYAWNAPTYGYNYNTSLKMLTGIHP